MKYYFAILILLFAVSCSGKKEPKPPEDVISIEKMEEILYDVQIAEAIYMRGGQPSKAEGRDKAKQLYGRIYEKHDITEEKFKRSYKWYSAHPEILNDIYERLLERYSEDQTLLEEDLKKEKEESEKS